MTLSVVREDLSQRTALSKSALVLFDLCQTKSWLDSHDRRPIIPSEKVSFGSALDAAIEILIVGEREGHEKFKADAAIITAIEEIEVRDDMDLPTEELLRAARSFRDEVLPKFDWSEVRTQTSLWADIPGLGEVNGHPDVLLPGRVFDVKSSSREKAMPSVELGLYGILLEAAETAPVEEVGYFTWVRSGKGRWVIQRMPLSAEIRRWTWEVARRYAAARELDNQAAFGGGPKFPGLCGDCQYAPWNGGGCSIAYKGGSEE